MIHKKIEVNINKIVSKLSSRCLWFSFYFYFLLQVKIAGNKKKSTGNNSVATTGKYALGRISSTVHRRNGVAIVRHFLLIVADRFVLMLPPNHTSLSLSQLAVTMLTHIYHNLSHLKMYTLGEGKFCIFSAVIYFIIYILNCSISGNHTFYGQKRFLISVGRYFWCVHASKDYC